MQRIAIVFPGQASQYVGMAKDLYDADSGVRRLYEAASSEIGEDLAELSFNGPADKLKETRFTQPAILIHSLAVLTVMKNGLPQASMTAGHSLGEYASLALSGVLTFEEAVKAVVKRSSLMEEACRQNPGTMAAIIGLDEGKILQACESASLKGAVVPANFNSSNQVVISGTIGGVEEACRLCKEMGARRAMVLQVGGAFHSPLMEPAREGMKEYLNSVEFRKASIDIVPNVTGEIEDDPERLKELLVTQLTMPVRWHQTMRCFVNNDIDTLIEIGPGKVLTGLAKRELRGAQIFNINTLDDIEKLSTVLIG